MKKHLLFPTFLLLALVSFGQMGYNSNPHAHGPSVDNYGYIPALPMSQGDFSSAMQTIESKSFDSSKLQIAEAVANSNYLTSGQVREITELFDFESSRLKFAKDAFAAVIDPGNYYQVNDAFNFDSSIRELDAYVRNHSSTHRGAGYNAGAGRGQGTIGYNVSGDDDIGYNAGATRGGRGTRGGGGIGYNAGATPGGRSCDRPNGGIHVTYGVSQADFSDMKRSIENRSFDSSKLALAKQMASTNPLSARQVCQMMEMMCFESTRLDLAKFAYHYVINPNRYFVVNDAFTFSSSTTELHGYINGQ